jgi:Na+/melibiose symporter-like transporter
MRLVFKLTFTFIDIPLNVSIGRFECSSAKRNYIAASRSVASTLSKLAIAILIASFVENDNVIDTDKLWIVATVIAILVPILIIPTFSYIDKSAQILDARYKYHPGEIKLGQAYKAIPRNLKLLIGANFFVLVMVAQFSNGLIFLVNDNPIYDISFTLIWQFMAIISAFSVVLWMILAGSIKKNITAVINLFLLAILLLCHSFFLSTGTGILVFVCIYVAVYHINSLMWSMLPDTADEVSERLESNMQVPTIGLFAALGKSMIGLGLLASGYILELSGFPNSPDLSLFADLIIYSSFFGCIGGGFCFAQYRKNVTA